MEISEVQIFVIRQTDTLLGFGNLTIDNFIRISGLGIHTTKEGGLRVVFPGKSVGSGFVYYVQPINEEAKKQIEKAFEEKAKEIGLFSL